MSYFCFKENDDRYSFLSVIIVIIVITIMFMIVVDVVVFRREGRVQVSPA